MTGDDAVLSRLRESERRFRDSMEHSPIGMALTAIDGTWIDVNPALCEFLGYSKQELMKAGFKKVTHPDDRDATVRLAIQMVMSRQKSVKLEKRYIHANGQLLTGILNLTVVRDRNEVPVMFISQIQDMTASRRLDHLKSEFITTVNHELRTPLTGIIGALSLLEQISGEGNSDSYKNLIAIASKNASRLKSLLDDVLEMETLSSDIFEPLPQEVDIPELVQRVASDTQFKADAASVQIKCGAMDSGMICSSDPEKLSRVFSILISNAVKFSERDTTVIVDVETISDFVRVLVSNQGRQIPMEMREFIFKPFVQGDPTSTRRKEGAGLGLAIARQLVQHLGGDLDYSSSADKTVFWVDIPTKKQ